MFPMEHSLYVVPVLNEVTQCNSITKKHYQNIKLSCLENRLKTIKIN